MNKLSVAPITKLVEISASDSAENLCRGIMLETAGSVALLFDDDSTPITLPLNASQVYPFVVKKVLQTGTTTTGRIFGGK